jgi:hypothetical protein
VTFGEFFKKSIASVFLVLVDSGAVVNSPDRDFDSPEYCLRQW